MRALQIRMVAVRHQRMAHIELAAAAAAPPYPPAQETINSMNGNRGFEAAPYRFKIRII